MQLSSARQKLKNQTQNMPSSFIMTAVPGTLTGSHLAQIGAHSELYPSQGAVLGSSNHKMYQTDTSDQPRHPHLPMQPSGGPLQPSSSAVDPHQHQQQNARVQSERYLSTAGNGSQQSQSSKMLKTKKKPAKY